MAPDTGLNTGLLISTNDVILGAKRLPLPHPGVQVQDPPSLGGEERVTRPNRKFNVNGIKWYIEEILFSLKHYWRFVDCKALELTALSWEVDEKAA
jgi:hypothetical protein